MTLHRVGSTAWRKSRQTPISKNKPERPRRIQERHIDWDAAAGQEWIDTYLPDADTTGYDPVQVAQCIQDSLERGQEPTMDAVAAQINPPAPLRRWVPSDHVPASHGPCPCGTVHPAVVLAGGECPRCGQVFRFTTGRAWHLANRPACKQEAMRRMVA